MRDYNKLNNENQSRNYELLLNSKSNNNSLFKQPKPNMNKQLVKVLDSLSNPIARLGVNTDNIINAAEYLNENITQNYQMLNNLYRDNWVIQNIIAAVPNDITKKWFNVKANIAPSALDKLDKLYRKTGLIKSINEGMRWGRLYGGAIGIIMIKGQTDNLEEPLDYDLITPDSFLGIFILDRWQGAYPCLDVVLNPEDSDFGLPQFYDIVDSSINIYARVHHSKVIRFIGRELPQFEKIKELYWGVSEVESIYRELVRRDTTAENIASLIFKANLSVLNIKDLDQMLALNSIQAQDRFWNIIESISTVESSLGIKLVNEGDRAEYLNYSFNGVKDIYETMMMDLAGASRIPVTKLFGRSPAGMNSTGESDLQNYYDYIDEVREGQFRDIVMKLLPILALSCWGEIPNDLDFEFEEMKTLDDSEKAQLNQQISSSILEAFNSNLITQDIAQKELKNLSEKTGVFTNITDELIEQSKGKFINDLQQMNDPMAGMMGGGAEQGGGDNPLAALMGGGQEPPMPNNAPNSQDAIIDNENNEPKDEVTLQLENLKNKLLNEQPNPQYNTKLGWEGTLVNNQDNLLREYDRIEKLNKKISKEYDEATNLLYGYNTNDIPLNMLNAYDKLKNQYNNSCADLQRIKDEIIKAGYNIDLLKHTGDFDKEITDIKEQMNKLNQVANILSTAPAHDSNSISRYNLLQIVDSLININDKINLYRKHKIHGKKGESIDNEIADINKKIEAQFANFSNNLTVDEGNENSGNHGHAGIPGKVGGSKPTKNHINEDNVSEKGKETLEQTAKLDSLISGKNSIDSFINNDNPIMGNSEVKKAIKGSRNSIGQAKAKLSGDDLEAAAYFYDFKGIKYTKEELMLEEEGDPDSIEELNFSLANRLPKAVYSGFMFANHYYDFTDEDISSFKNLIDNSPNKPTTIYRADEIDKSLLDKIQLGATMKDLLIKPSDISNATYSAQVAKEFYKENYNSIPCYYVIENCKNISNTMLSGYEEDECFIRTDDKVLSKIEKDKDGNLLLYMKNREV